MYTINALLIYSEWQQKAYKSDFEVKLSGTICFVCLNSFHIIVKYVK